RAAGDELVLHLGAAPRSIHGRVLDASGAPVAGAAVWTPDTTPFGLVAQESGENSFLGDVTLEAFLVGPPGPWESSAHALTGADGAFELDGLLDRPYALFALDPRTLAGAGPLELSGGDEHGLLRLDAPVARAIAGRVRSPSGTPLAGVRVALGRS